MNKYSTLLSSIKEFFDVNDDLKNELNNIALNEHGKSLEELFDLWAKNNSSLPENEYNELINYMNDLNKEPHSISELEELYSFVYDFGRAAAREKRLIMNTQFYYAYKNARHNNYIDTPQCDYDYFEIEYKNGKGCFNILLFNLVCKFTLTDYKKVISMLSDDSAGQEKAEKLHDLYIEIAKVLTSDKEKYSYDKKILADISDAFNRLNKLNEALMNCFTIDSLDLEKTIKMKKATAYKMIGKDQLIVDYNAKSFEKFGYTWIVSIDAKVRGRKHIIVPSCGLPCATYDGSFKEAIEILDKELFTRVMNAMKNYDPAAFFNLLKENDIKEIPAFKVDDPTESTPEALKRIENVTIEEFYNKYMWGYDLLFNAEKVNISLEYSKHERCFKLYLPELSNILGEFNTYRNDYRLDDRDTAAFIMAIEHFQKCNKKTIAGYPLPSFSDLQERIEKEEAWKNTIELENMQISAAVGREGDIMREFKLIEEKYGTYAEFYKYSPMLIDGKRKVKRLITPSELIVVKDILARKDNDALENFIYSHL